MKNQSSTSLDELDRELKIRAGQAALETAFPKPLAQNGQIVYDNGMPSAILTPRRLILCALILFLLTGLIPPWRVAEKNRATGHLLAERVEFNNIWSAPSTPSAQYGGAVQSHIALDILGVEWIVIAGAAGLLIWLKRV